MADTIDPRYPIGKFTPPELISSEDRRYAIHILAEMPGQLRDALRDLDAEQLNTPYREDGCTVRQLVHHIADSHMTAFLRACKALTEDWPVVVGYDRRPSQRSAMQRLPSSGRWKLLRICMRVG